MEESRLSFVIGIVEQDQSLTLGQGDEQQRFRLALGLCRCVRTTDSSAFQIPMCSASQTIVSIECSVVSECYALLQPRQQQPRLMPTKLPVEDTGCLRVACALLPPFVVNLELPLQTLSDGRI